MDFFKNFFKSLTVSKILVLFTGILMIIAATMHGVFRYADQAHPIYSAGTFFAFLFGGIAAIALLFPFKGKYAAIPAFAGSTIGFAMFIVKCWIFVSDVIAGIDAFMTPQFLLNIIPMAISLVLSAIGFCLLNPASGVAYKILTTSMGLLFPLLLAGGAITQDSSAAAMINRTLKTSESIVEKIDDSGAEEDTEYFKSRYKDIESLNAAGAEQCESVAGEGFVLLKNADALPLDKGAKTSLFSVSTADPVYGGTGSGSVDTSTAPTLKAGLEHNDNLSVNDTLWNYYSDTEQGGAYRRTQGSVGAGVKGPRTIGEAPWSEVSAACGSSFANFGDAAIFMVSRVGGEGSDSPRQTYSLNKLTDVDGTAGDSTDGEYLVLSPKERETLRELKALKEAGTFKKVIVVINTANQVECDFIDQSEYGVDAALWIGTPGSYGFNALGDILVGEVNPSGHLSATFWADHHQNPVHPNFGPKVYADSPDGYADAEKGTMNADRVYTVYQEGIYLGHHYTESRYEDYVVGKDKVGDFDYSAVVSYPFGYGLSYTEFDYSDYKVQKHGNGAGTYYTVTVKVTNTGSVSGKDVVEVYLDKPFGAYNEENGVEASASELVGFAKTGIIEAGKSETVEINVKERQFTSYDSKKAGTYVITGGDYYLSVGEDAHDAIHNALAAKGYTKATTSDRMEKDGDPKLSEKISLSFDSNTFSTHEKTGAAIRNLFQDVDYNNYEHKAAGDEVKYITRSDWAGTVHLDWSDHTVLHYNDKLQEDLDALGRQEETKLPEDKSAYPTFGAEGELQLISLREDEDGNKIAYDDPVWDEFLDQITWDEAVNVIDSGMRMSAAIESVGKPQNTDQNGPNGCTERFNYNKSTKVGLFWKNYAEDADEGKLRPTCYPSAGVRASTWNVDLSFATGDQIGDDALWVGYNGLYGPGSNIQRTPYGGRNYEYYSEDPVLSGEVCGYECAAMENRGLYVYNKHFALNELEDMRRGVQTWANEQTVREIYLRAFEIPVNMEGEVYNYNGTEVTMKGASGVMVAMNRVGLFWTGMRKSFMTDYLRTEIGMTGIAVTDMWFGSATPYLNFPAMLKAGTNLIDGGRPATDLDESKANHADVAWGIRESIHRICYTTVHSNAMNGYSSNMRIRHVDAWWRHAVLAAQIGAGVVLGGGLALGGISIAKGLKKKEL